MTLLPAPICENSESFTTSSEEANVAVRALQFAADEINAGQEVPFRFCVSVHTPQILGGWHFFRPTTFKVVNRKC